MAGFSVVIRVSLPILGQLERVNRQLVPLRLRANTRKLMHAYRVVEPLRFSDDGTLLP
jgi:hypothetical protein